MTLVFSSFLDMVLCLSSCVIAVLPPFGGVGIHVVPNAEIVRVGADDVVVVTPLPNIFSASQSHLPLKISNDPWYGTECVGADVPIGPSPHA